VYTIPWTVIAQVFGRFKQFALLVKDLAQSLSIEKERSEESKARVNLLHNREKSVEDLGQVVSALQELRFEPNGIRRSIRQMLEEGEPPTVLRGQMGSSIYKLDRLITLFDANSYYEARFPSVMASARRIHGMKAALLDDWVRHFSHDFEVLEDVYRGRTRKAKQKLDPKQMEARNEFEVRIAKALAELENEFDEVNAAISKAVEAMSEYVRGIDAKIEQTRPVETAKSRAVRPRGSSTPNKEGS
jgi:hypothetical protein